LKDIKSAALLQIIDLVAKRRDILPEIIKNRPWGRRLMVLVVIFYFFFGGFFNRFSFCNPDIKKNEDNHGGDE